MSIYIIAAIALAVILVVAVPFAAARLGGLLDDQTEHDAQQDAEREAHYTNLDGTYRTGRVLR